MSAPDPQSLLAWVPRLRRYARVLCPRAEDADDLVQDTLERAWSKATHWHGVGDMRAWLFGVMHHLHVDGRRRAPPPAESIDDAALPAAPEGPGALLLDLEAALQRLSAEQREVLLLVGVEQLSYAEVSQALGIPIGTVMSRLCRARERLRALMEGRSAPPVRLTRVK